MALKAKFQGREHSKSRDEQIYTEVFYGTELEVDTFITGLSIGTKVEGKGYLHQWQKRQENPAVWEVEVTYRTTYGLNTAFNYEGDDDETSNKTYSLSVRNIQIPIENHSSYKAKWNHFLLGLGNSVLPAWWATATNTLLSPLNRQYYQWVSSLSEVPIEPNEMGLYWVVLAMPTKPGVSVYDEACFVVTESSRYKTSSAAGSHIAKNINEIHDPPHKFGISGGEWKVDEGRVEHDGKRWIATQVWTRAAAWDSDLYAHPND